MGRARRKGVVIIGPTPPPYHGMSVFTRQILRSPVLNAAYELHHVETADRRALDNMGRLEPGNVVLALRHAGVLAWTILRRRPTVVYVEVSQNPWAYVRDAVFIVTAKALGRRVVVHLHGSEFRSFYERSNALCRWLVRWTSRMVDAAAVLGPGLRPIYEGLVPSGRVHSVPNGVEDPFPEGPRREAGAAGRGVTVTYLGMLYEPKGFLDLLRAAALLRDRAPPLRFVFAGEWFSERERAAASSLVAREGLREVVSFPGRVDGEAKRRLLRDSDILVFPSRQPEGLPLVILEAMAAGVAVVSTDTGAVRDVVEDGRTGLIIGKGAPEELASAIRRLAADEAERLRLGGAARRDYEEGYTDQRCAERLAALFEAACAGG